MTRMTFLPESQENKQSGIPSLGVGFSRAVEAGGDVLKRLNASLHSEFPPFLPPKNTDSSESRIRFRFPNPIPESVRQVSDLPRLLLTHA